MLTQPDRPAGRGMRPAPSAVKQLALRRGLELAQPASLKSDAVLAQLRRSQPEVMVVAAYGLLLPQAVLDLAPHGALNIHASLLPRWRGAAPIQRALLAGDAQTGVSIMKMDAGLDTGPLLAQRRVAIAADDDAASLHDKLAALGAEEIVAALAQLHSGSARPVSQPEEGASYARKIEKRETWLEWSRPAAELERAVRAFRPAPCAAARLDGEPLKIWRASVVPARGMAGEVLEAGAQLVVACGEQALAIAELQRAGGRRLTAGEFLRGRRLRPGARFA